MEYYFSFAQGVSVTLLAVLAVMLIREKLIVWKACRGVLNNDMSWLRLDSRTTKSRAEAVCSYIAKQISSGKWVLSIEQTIKLLYCHKKAYDTDYRMLIDDGSRRILVEKGLTGDASLADKLRLLAAIQECIPDVRMSALWLILIESTAIALKDNEEGWKLLMNINSKFKEEGPGAWYKTADHLVKIGQYRKVVSMYGNHDNITELGIHELRLFFQNAHINKLPEDRLAFLVAEKDWKTIASLIEEIGDDTIRGLYLDALRVANMLPLVRQTKEEPVQRQE